MNSFDDFWNAYQKKVGKDKVESKWYRLPAQDHILIMNHVHGFVAKQRNKQYRPNPLSYLNGKMWLNEDITQEQKLVYRIPEAKPLSTYKPKEFPPEKGTEFIKSRIKQYFDTGVYRIRDYGEIYTNRLKHLISIPESVKQQIRTEVLKEANTPRRNRFEPIVDIDVKYEIRNRELKWWLNRAKSEGRDISDEV